MALRYRVLAAVAAVVPLALFTACCGAAGPFVPAAAQASPGGGIPAGPAPGPQALTETGSTLLFPLLHHWAAGDSGRRFDDLFNLVCHPDFLTVAWDRCGATRSAHGRGRPGDPRVHLR